MPRQTNRCVEIKKVAFLVGMCLVFQSSGAAVVRARVPFFPDLIYSHQHRFASRRLQGTSDKAGDESKRSDESCWFLCHMYRHMEMEGVQLRGNTVRRKPRTPNVLFTMRWTYALIPRSIDARDKQQQARMNESEAKPHQPKPTAASTPSLKALSLSWETLFFSSLS